MSVLEKATLRTICWFDIFDFPLTSWEVYKYIFFPADQEGIQGEVWQNFNTIIDTLEILKTKNQVQTYLGFYHLPGRAHIIKTRKERYRLAERKYHKALRVARFLKLIPWIRLISVCNTLGYSNAPDKSDIDLFIITTPRRVWITRFFTLSFLKIFGLRPRLARFGQQPEKRRDRIDANFFMTEESLNIKNLALADDVYLLYWLILQTPIYNLDNTYEKFVRANDWLKMSLPNIIVNQPSYRRQIKPSNQPLRWLGQKLTMDLAEKNYRWLQLKILPANLKSQLNQATHVVANDQVLKFHDQDKREYYRDQWKTHLNLWT